MNVAEFARVENSCFGPLRVLVGRGVSEHPDIFEALSHARLGRSVVSAALGVGGGGVAPPGCDFELEEDPAATAAAYVTQALQRARAWEADIYWPGRELVEHASRLGDFAHAGVRLLSCSTPPHLRLLEDTLQFGEFARKLGISSPRGILFESIEGFERAYEAIVSMGERACFRPCRGTFARGFRVVRTDIDPFDEMFAEATLQVELGDARRRFALRERFLPMLAMEWLSGPEWSVDCFRSVDGATFVGCARRKVAEDVQWVGENSVAVEYSRKIADALGLQGLFNCQFKEHRGAMYVLEVHARPVDGCGASELAGARLVELALKDALGLPLELDAGFSARRVVRTSRWHEAPMEVEHERLAVPSKDARFRLLRTWQLPGGALTIEAENDAFEELVIPNGRNNPRRGYLLVSRLLGKHVPVSPSRMMDAHVRLAAEIPENLPGPVAFIGMAETATGLGWGVYAAWCSRTRRSDAVYLHSSRYAVPGAETLEFEESHSHGPKLALAIPSSGEARERFVRARSLVVIDDEITTGRTISELSNVLKAWGIVAERRVAVSLVTAAASSGELGDALKGWDLVSLARFRTTWSPVPQSDEPNSAMAGLTRLNQHCGSRGWGRCGAIAVPEMPRDLPSEVDASTRGAPLIHVVGTAELMHPAFLLARALEALGRPALVQATTRSPALLGPGIVRTLACADGLGSGVPHFLHNPPRIENARTVVLYERGAERSAASLTEAIGAIPIEVWDA